MQTELKARTSLFSNQNKLYGTGWHNEYLFLNLKISLHCVVHHTYPPHQNKTDHLQIFRTSFIHRQSHLIWSFWFSLQNNIPASAMTRRNTYVCTDRSSTDRHSLLQNGKENRWEEHRCLSVFRLIFYCKWQNPLTRFLRSVTSCGHFGHSSFLI